MENYEENDSSLKQKAIMKKKLIHAFVSGILLGVGFVIVIIAVAMLW